MKDYKSLRDLVKDLESRFPVGQPTSSSRSVTGEPYVTVVSGGIKEEGMDYPLVCSSEEAAIRHFKDAINAYAADKKGAIYWRQRPFPKNIKGYFTVYSRVLISDRLPNAI